MHHVVILAFDGVIAHDLTLAAEAFERANSEQGAPLYSVSVAGSRAEVDAGFFTMRCPYKISEAAPRADTIVVPGLARLDQALPEVVREALMQAAGRGVRLLSICTGAFVLARYGLLDGSRATTHWRAAAALASLHPKVEVDPRPLFIDHGHIATSAGAAAGFDLCVHVIRKDHGNAVAAELARNAVLPPLRTGDQAQFVTPSLPEAQTTPLAALLAKLEERVEHSWTLGEMARQGKVSERTLSRRFQQHLGISPYQWLLRARVRRAQTLLETTSLPVERVAEQTGFGSALALRQHFIKYLSTPPSIYRQQFNSQEVSCK